MIIEYEGKSFDLDIEELEVDEARVIKRYAGMTLKGFEEGLAEGDPDALTCLYWLILRQNGEEHNIERIKFKPVKLARAVSVAQEAEAAKAKAEEAPKDEEPEAAPAKRSASSKATSKN